MWAVAASMLFFLGVNPYLDQGRTLYREVRYSEAEVQLRLGLDVPTATAFERREAHDLLARVLLAQGRGEEAKQIYARLLSVDPGASSPENASPKVRAAFGAAKKAVFPPDYVRFEERTVRPDRFAADLIDPWGKVALLVVVTVRAEGPRPELFKPPAVTRLDLPRPDAPFFVEARDREDRVLAQVGTLGAPLAGLEQRASLPVAEAISVREERSGRWVGWGLSAVAVALVVTGAVLAVSSEQDYRAAGESSSAVERRGLDARYRDQAIGSRVALGAGLAAGLGGGWVLWTWH